MREKRIANPNITWVRRNLIAYKFGDYNVGREGALLTLPSYMGFLLEFEGVEDMELPKLDIEEVNRMAEEMMKEWVAHRGRFSMIIT